MIITDDFVMLAFPKTATSFTTAVLRNIHARRRMLGRIGSYEFQKKLFKKMSLQRPGYREHLIPRYEALAGQKQRYSRHGGYSDIPLEDRSKGIVSVCRNPFSRAVSAYQFQYMSRSRIRPPAEIDILLTRFPNYPNIEFSDYLDMSHEFSRVRYLQGLKPKIDIGSQSLSFIRFYFKDPSNVIAKIDDDYIESGAYRDDMVDVTFIEQEHLRQQFSNFLQRHSYSSDECALVETFSAQNVSVKKSDRKTAMDYYSPKLVSVMLKREALMFKVFPQYLPVNIS